MCTEEMRTKLDKKAVENVNIGKASIYKNMILKCHLKKQYVRVQTDRGQGTVEDNDNIWNLFHEFRNLPNE